MATFDVELTGGAPWGFSMVGGSDFNQPLNISKVISPQNLITKSFENFYSSLISLISTRW